MQFAFQKIASSNQMNEYSELYHLVITQGTGLPTMGGIFLLKDLFIFQDGLFL